MGRPRGAGTSQADRWTSPWVDPEGPRVVTSPRPSPEGGETEAPRGGRTCGRTLPTAQPELSVALTEKLSGKNTHTQNSGFFPKPLISSNCAVSAHQRLTQEMVGGRSPAPRRALLRRPGQTFPDADSCHSPPATPPTPVPQRLPHPPPPAAWPGWWEVCAAPSWQLPVLGRRARHRPGQTPPRGPAHRAGSLSPGRSAEGQERVWPGPGFWPPGQMLAAQL